MATSLPGSASGLTPCVAQDGPMIALSGLVHAHASLSAKQAKEQGLLTSGTFGLISITSLSSVALRSSLVNRLQAKMASHGSTIVYADLEGTGLRRSSFRSMRCGRRCPAPKAKIVLVGHSDNEGAPGYRQPSKFVFSKGRKKRNDTLYRRCGCTLLVFMGSQQGSR